MGPLEWPPIMLSNKFVNFQPIPFISFGNNNLHAKILTKVQRWCRSHSSKHYLEQAS
jgi:hypothetical protein